MGEVLVRIKNRQMQQNIRNAKTLKGRIRETQQHDWRNTTAGSGKLNIWIREAQKQDQDNSTAESRKLNSRIKGTQQQDQENSTTE